MYLTGHQAAKMLFAKKTLLPGITLVHQKLAGAQNPVVSQFLRSPSRSRSDCSRGIYSTKMRSRVWRRGATLEISSGLFFNRHSATVVILCCSPWLEQPRLPSSGRSATRLKIEMHP